MAHFVDTNIILRFLVRDDETQFRACKQLFQKAQRGQINLTTSSLVIFETIWTLDSFYQQPKTSIIEKVSSLLELPHFDIEHRDILLEALVLWQQHNINFNDAFNYVWARNHQVQTILSYNQHFDRLPQITRQQP